jgi:Cft2 family RNA processing exonuclease
VFHWEGGLKLTKAGLALDFPRRQPRAFISHAHADHMARHEYALCTPATGELYRLRLGKRRVLELPYREPIEWGGLRLATFPSGHCLGSAMLLAEDGNTSLLYTGDFKLGECLTAEPAELPRADILVMECTFGRPEYRLPPRGEAIGRLCELVGRAISQGCMPVVEAYALGKAQEVTRILTAAGFAVLQHERVHEISQVYRARGVDLGDFAPYRGQMKSGKVLVVPPRTARRDPIARPVRFAVTGWAVHPQTKYRLGVDHAIPLSDHADYAQLFEAVAEVRPRTVYCTHGPESFADRLRDEGFDAHPLGTASQRRLF